MRRIDMALVITVITSVLLAGMWLGRLEQRVATLEQQQRYYHGEAK